LMNAPSAAANPEQHARQIRPIQHLNLRAMLLGEQCVIEPIVFVTRQ